LYMASLSLSLCGLNNEHNVFDFNVSDAHFRFVIIFTIPVTTVLSKNKNHL